MTLKRMAQVNDCSRLPFPVVWTCNHINITEKVAEMCNRFLIEWIWKKRSPKWDFLQPSLHQLTFFYFYHLESSRNMSSLKYLCLVCKTFRGEMKKCMQECSTFNTQRAIFGGAKHTTNISFIDFIP